MRNDHDFQEAAERLKAAKAAKDTAEVEYRAALDAITLLAPDGGKGFGVTIAQVITKGRIAYAQAIKALLPGANLEPWRGSESISYRVTIDG